MLTLARPRADPGTGEWRCRCGEVLGIIVANTLRVIAPSSWYTATTVRVRCPNCRSRESFDLRDLAA
jgi:hypothetical protein